MLQNIHVYVHVHVDGYEEIHVYEKIHVQVRRWEWAHRWMVRQHQYIGYKTKRYWYMYQEDKAQRFWYVLKDESNWLHNGLSVHHMSLSKTLTRGYEFEETRNIEKIYMCYRFREKMKIIRLRVTFDILFNLHGIRIWIHTKIIITTQYNPIDEYNTCTCTCIIMLIQHSCPVLPRISGEVMIASIHVHVCTSDPRTVLRTDIGYTV